MTYDLQQRLRDLEQNAPTGTLDVTLIDRLATRRRRGRAAGTSALSVAVLAAVAVAAVGGLTAPTKTVTPPSGPPQCGEPMPATRAGDGSVDLTLLGFGSTHGNTGVAPVVRATAALESAPRRDGAYTTDATYLVADGTIVAADFAPGSSESELDKWSVTSVSGAGMPLTGCSGAPLPDGDYEAYVYRTFTPMAGGPEEVTIGGGAPLRVVGGVAVPLAVDTGDALRATATIVDAGQQADGSQPLPVVTTGQGFEVPLSLSHPDGTIAVLAATVVALDASGDPIAAGPPAQTILVPGGSHTPRATATAGTIRDLGTGAPLAPGSAHLRVDVTGYTIDTATGAQKLVGTTVDLGEVALP